MATVLLQTFCGAIGVAAGVAAYGMVGRSSRLFGTSVYRGPRDRPAIALTFDDGPSESTPKLLELLSKHGVPATFFQCGMNVARLPQISREVAAAGHEIGNHSYSHGKLCFRSRKAILDELWLGQATVAEATGSAPVLFRAPYGVRWPGLGEAQRRLGLTGVMWTSIAMDWKFDSARIVNRLLGALKNGAIFCLHDGRDIQRKPDIRETLEAVRRLLPELQALGFRFETVSQLVCPKN